MRDSCCSRRIGSADILAAARDALRTRMRRLGHVRAMECAERDAYHQAGRPAIAEGCTRRIADIDQELTVLARDLDAITPALGRRSKNGDTSPFFAVPEQRNNDLRKKNGDTSPFLTPETEADQR